MMVIPRHAVHDAKVYVVDDKKTLVIKPVSVTHYQGELAVVASGLEENDEVIVTDLIPLIEGMPVLPRHNEDIQIKITRLALGDSR
jgi:hypothetical protein